MNGMNGDVYFYCKTCNIRISLYEQKIYNGSNVYHQKCYNAAVKRKKSYKKLIKNCASVATDFSP